MLHLVIDLKQVVLIIWNKYSQCYSVSGYSDVGGTVHTELLSKCFAESTILTA